MIVIALTAMVGLFSEQAMQKLKTIAEAILTTTPPGANHAPPSVVASTPVTLSAIDQITGPRTGGQSVKIQGSGFAAGAKVSFGTVAATDVTVVSATVITAKTPPHDPGAVDVTVTNSDGQIASLKNAYTYI